MILLITEDIQIFINGLKDLISSTLNFLPLEIQLILVSVLIILIALYIYRLIR